MAEKRQRFSPEKKLEILREYLKNRTPLSELCEKNGIHPNVVYRWEKQFLEGGIAIFSGKHRDAGNGKAKGQRLQEKIVKQQEVIAWLTEENIKLKKVPMGRFEQAMGRARHSG